MASLSGEAQVAEENPNAWNFWLYDKTIGVVMPSRRNPIHYAAARVIQISWLKEILELNALEVPLFPYGYTYNFFKNGFQHNWNDPAQNPGDRYVLVYDSFTSSESINLLWNKLCSNLMEKQSWSRLGKLINGVKVERLANNYHKISIFTQEEITRVGSLGKGISTLFQDLFAYLPGIYKSATGSWSTAEILKSEPILIPTGGSSHTEWTNELDAETILQNATRGELLQSWEFKFSFPPPNSDESTDFIGHVLVAENMNEFRFLLERYKVMTEEKFSQGFVHNFHKKGVDFWGQIIEPTFALPTAIFYLPIFPTFTEAQEQWKKITHAMFSRALADSHLNDYESGAMIRRFQHDSVDSYQISLWTRLESVDDNPPQQRLWARGILAEEMGRGKTRTYGVYFRESHRSRKPPNSNQPEDIPINLPFAISNKRQFHLPGWTQLIDDEA